MDLLTENFIYFFIFLNIYFCYHIYSKVQNYLKEKSRLNRFEYFSEIYAVFNSSKEDAFNNLYRQELSTILLSRINNTEKIKILKEKEEIYIRKVIELCGPNIINDLNELLGNTDSIILNINNFYITKILEVDLEIFDNNKRSEFSEDEVKEMNETLNGIFK